MKIAMMVKKHRQAYTTVATLPLLLLIVSMLTVPVMLFSAPLAAADVKADCEKDGGTYVVNAAGHGHCYVRLEPDCHKLPAGEVVPDPELCLKGGIVNNPISNGNDIAEIVEDTLNEVMSVVSDGNDRISEAVREALE
jgi:hypothetical protein